MSLFQPGTMGRGVRYRCGGDISDNFFCIAQARSVSASPAVSQAQNFSTHIGDGRPCKPVRPDFKTNILSYCQHGAVFQCDNVP